VRHTHTHKHNTLLSESLPTSLPLILPFPHYYHGNRFRLFQLGSIRTCFQWTHPKRPICSHVTSQVNQCFFFFGFVFEHEIDEKDAEKNKRHQSNKKNGAATPELGRPHTRIKLLDCTLTSWMDMIKCDRIMKIFPGPSSIRTIKSLLKPWKPTAEGVELLLRARVLEAALFVAGGAYFCITWCFSQLLCSWTEFLYASDSHS